MDDMYGDNASPSQSESPEDMQKEKMEDKDGEQAETTLIPKRLCEDCKVGEEITFKVVHIYEDEIEIEYAKGEKPSENENEMDGEEMTMAKGRMNSLGGM